MRLAEGGGHRLEVGVGGNSEGHLDLVAVLPVDGVDAEAQVGGVPRLVHELLASHDEDGVAGQVVVGVEEEVLRPAAGRSGDAGELSLDQRLHGGVAPAVVDAVGREGSEVVAVGVVAAVAHRAGHVRQRDVGGGPHGEGGLPGRDQGCVGLAAVDRQPEGSV